MEVGTTLGDPALDTVVGGAAAFIPCEASLGHTGAWAADGVTIVDQQV